VATFLLVLTAVPAAAANLPLEGKAAILMDGTTGQILYDYNGNEKNYPASTTKLLTALVAVEHAAKPDLTQMIKVSAKAVDMPPDSSACYLNAGEEQTLKNLLYGLLLASGNDCANAIAEGLTNGNTQQFVQWMNETAVRVGATSTHFTNPHGYHEDGHFTTARDLAVISKAALNNPSVREISSTHDFFWPGKSEQNGVYYNHTRMLFDFPAADAEKNGFTVVAGKTGFTDEAQHTLVTGAEHNGLWLIGVVMGETSLYGHYDDMQKLLAYGFKNFTTRKVVTDGTLFGEVAVTGAKETSVKAVVKGDFVASVPTSGTAAVTTEAKLQLSVAAPVTQGQKLGDLEIKQDGKLLGTLPLYASADVAVRPSPFKGLLSGTLAVLKWLAYIFIGLLVFRTTVKTVRRVLRRSRRKGQPNYRPAPRQNRGTIDLYRTRSR
jgi:D-alanyl-D-alanine carboxypeptidase